MFSQSPQNKQQLINVFFNFINEFIGISISTIYFWTIPKLTLSTPQIINTHILQTNLTLTPYDIIVLISNFITLLFIIYLYITEIKREVWLITHFDYSNRYDNLHLTTYRTSYPRLFETLKPMNLKYQRLYKILRILCIINFLISSSIIVSLEFSDYKTVTTLFTNGYLIYSKYSKGLKVAGDSVASEIGYSYFNTQSISFNRIDSKYKTHHSNSNLENSRNPNPEGSSGSINSNSPNNSLNNSINIPNGINKLFLSSTDGEGEDDLVNTIDLTVSIET